ncbi:hypothetical protein FP742_14075 [Vibrio parahaemolyticus]|uniref:Uncharacterized protein n=2 Tax=Vibrio parahaemolyticus TaxID=670 RepID=A0A227JHS1_VIBPH|nr:hypothetical protein A6J30_21410 [Vibrio parahaemolyticus]BAC62687.1 hypothetical protein [Vibrio parahaemolyticus RIMD 2210633]AZV73629.1 hypothetical protein D0853_22005 [Vibrio parahaemolyticus]EGQ8459426.1 hypothetical protein [Vibrio parahaemolyticus]EGQ8464426.1 hypothetical protein [Vibrio parahaemolyticus]
MVNLIFDSVLWILGDIPLNDAKLTPIRRQKIVKKNGKTGGKMHLMNLHRPSIKLHFSPALCPLN